MTQPRGEARGKLCGIFMLKTAWQRQRQLGCSRRQSHWRYLGVDLGAILVWILALPAPDWMTAWLRTENEYSLPGNLDRDKDDRYLVAEVILRCLTGFLLWISLVVIGLIGWAYYLCADGLHKIRAWFQNHYRSTQVERSARCEHTSRSCG